MTAAFPFDVDPARRQLVLVADSDALTRIHIGRVVAQLGLITLAADSSASALAAVQEYASELACALLDLSLPCVLNIVLAAIVGQLDPQLPLVLTGEAALLLTAAVLLGHRQTQLLPKPVTS